MDTLALLCNLYGDGPQTLRRLREAGCGTLAALESLECERLASLLRTSVRSAKRFQIEGRLLRERSELGFGRSVPRRADERAVEQDSGADPLMVSVLSAWREHDARGGQSPAPAAGTTAAEPSAALPTSRAEGRELAQLDGMDSALLSRLAQAGAGTLEAFCDADVLDLAGRGVAGYTRLLHLQFLARRARGGRVQVEGRLEVAEPPARAHDEPAPSALPSVPRRDVDPEPQPQEQEPALARVIAPQAVVLVPARPPERRGGARSGPFPVQVLRFSPRDDLQELASLELESDLERHAAGRRSESAVAPEAEALQDGDSSGPFA